MFKHYIWLKTEVTNVNKLINKLSIINIPIYDIKKDNEKVLIKTEDKYFQKLEKYLISYKFKKVQDVGLWQIKNIIKKNLLMVIIFIIGLVMYFLFTNVLIDVKVIHENKEIRELLLDELKERGIRSLTFKKSYQELDKIKKEILDKYPDKLDWLEIEVQGMVYNVKVEERIITDTTKENKTCDIVAKKAGTISNIKVFMGEALVNINDYVRENTVLISGKTIYNGEEKRSICASGEVYAKVWYTTSVSIPFNYYTYERTGKTKYNIVIENDSNKKRILKNRFLDYDYTLKPLLKLFDFGIYIERDYETKKISKTYTEEEALEEGLKKADESLKKTLGKKDHIIDKKVLKKTINDSTMDIEIFVVTEELIGREVVTTN